MNKIVIVIGIILTDVVCLAFNNTNFTVKNFNEKIRYKEESQFLN